MVIAMTAFTSMFRGHPAHANSRAVIHHHEPESRHVLGGQAEGDAMARKVDKPKPDEDDGNGVGQAV